MQVTMKTEAAGPAGNFHLDQTYDMTDEQGQAFIDAGAAVLAVEPEPVVAPSAGEAQSESDTTGDGGAEPAERRSIPVSEPEGESTEIGETEVEGPQAESADGVSLA